ncbi:uncharacterized protein LOC143631647 [Bidens hawaiensis]|uniref:uncharacterized protein LOC143631647 n=1 Tax=Bidens hawaiensis TaxID=980011 RepID=UPI00404B25EF
MAKTFYSVMALLFVFNLLISLTMAGRNIPNTNVKKPDDDVKHPENFFYYDRGYLIPGLGRGIKPKSKKGFNPFTYNPITGSNNGFPRVSVPNFGGFGGGSYLPGGDDTLVPNPGVEVPNPAGGSGNAPVNPGVEVPEPAGGIGNTPTNPGVEVPDPAGGIGNAPTNPGVEVPGPAGGIGNAPTNPGVEVPGLAGGIGNAPTNPGVEVPDPAGGIGTTPGVEVPNPVGGIGDTPIPTNP